MSRLPESWIDKPEEAEIQAHLSSLVKITITMSNVWHIDLEDVRDGLIAEIERQIKLRSECERQRKEYRPVHGF